MKVLLGCLSLLIGQGTPIDWAFIHRIRNRRGFLEPGR